jgi:hypothetical protein
MRPLLADIERHGVAIVAAAAAIVATYLVRDRAAPPPSLAAADLPVTEEVTTSTHDPAPYLTADLDADGTDEVIVPIEGPRGAELVVWARSYGTYVPAGEVSLEDEASPCTATVTIEDGLLMVTRYDLAPWSSGGCAPTSRVYYTVQDGRLTVVDAVLGP